MKVSRTVRFLILFSALASLVPASIKGLEEQGLLTLEDLSHEENDRQNGPALSSSPDDPNPWSSNNQWMCFDANQVQIDTIEIKPGTHWIPWPQISVVASGQQFDFSPETDLEINTEEVIEEWRSLFTQARGVCFYAAFLQYLDTEESQQPETLWVLEEFKTNNGYWHSTDATQKDPDSPESDEEEDH